MDWVKDFYSRTGHWWAAADVRVHDRDRNRVEVLHRLFGSEPKRILELGCGYGTTAAALADAGHQVVGVELSERADYATAFTDERSSDSMRVVRGDFYEVELEGRFDLVAYWNGFGIGTDADQRRLLRRISGEWLSASGAAVIDVFNPLVWASWDGDVDPVTPKPELGYHHDLMEHTRFDPVSNTAVDTWWDTAEPERKITQRLRCYSPADFRLLLEGTGLRLETILVGDRTLEIDADHAGDHAMLHEQYEYLAVMRVQP